MNKKTLWDIIRDPDCKRCDLYNHAQYICLIGRGPYPCETMMVGEGPGWREDDIGKPFAGKAGKLLDKILNSINVSRKNLFISNIVHCRPPENKTPKKKQMDACRYWLLKEIEYVKPKRIILLGKCAIYGLFQYDDYSIEYMRSRVYKYKGAKVYVTYHPAAALRRPYLKEVIRKDLLQIFGGDSSKSTIEIKYEDLTKTKAKELIENPPKSLAVDVETPGGVVFYKNPMTCLSFSPKAGVSYFIEDPEGMKKYITSFLENPSILKIGHSLKYDLKQLVYGGYLSEKSLIENEFFCTMIAFNILDENYLDKDLEHLTDMFTSMSKWKNNDLDFLDPDRLRVRNLKDTDATKRLYNIFRKRLEAEKLLIPFKIDMNLMKVLVSAELHGVKVNVDELNELDSELTKSLEKLKIKIPIDKPNSNLQLTKFFNSRGIKSNKETEAGGQSWDKNILQDLSKKLEGKKKEVIDSILEWKKLFGIQTKFLTNLREFLDLQNIVHPVFNQTKSFSDSGDEEGTVSGRLSCLKGSSRVRLENGISLRIKDIVKNKFSGKVLSYKDSKIVARKVVGWYKNKLNNRKSIKVFFKRIKGRGVTVTNDHLFLSRKGWIKGSKLNSGDVLATGTIKPIKGSLLDQLIVGNLLGDGSIKKEGRFCISHKSLHKKYLFLKKSILLDYESSTSEHISSKGHKFYRFNSKSLPYFKYLREVWYPKGKKEIFFPQVEKALTYFSLAVLFMDDGTTKFPKRKSPFSCIYTLSFSKEEVERLCVLIEEKLGIGCRSKKGYGGYFIRFSTIETKELHKNISRFFPSCMKYKLLPEFRSRNKNTKIYSRSLDSEVFYDEVVVNSSKIRDRSVYCIDVKETHNFITPGGVVHNCKNPALQQTPRDREDLPREINPRRLFIPTHPKGFIISADYNQIEVRIAAHDANDEVLIGMLESGKDIHLLVASEVLKKPLNKITRDERKAIKQVVFGIRYRISARGLSEKIGCSFDEAERYIRFFFRAFPRQEERIDEIESEIITKQEISNLFGRKRRLPGATQETRIGRALIRQGVNFPIQGGAVDIVKIAMYKIWKEFLVRELKSKIFANVHDAIEMDGYPGEQKEVIEIIKHYMENPGLEEYGVKLRVPLTQKIQVGPTWLDVKEI